MTIELNSDNFDSVVASSKLLFVDVWADWCGPCKQSTPVFKELASKLQTDEHVFGTLDAQTYMDAANKIGVMSLPTFAIFKEGELKKKWVGADIGRLRKEILTAVKD